jgi:hypothetical protein
MVERVRAGMRGALPESRLIGRLALEIDRQAMVPHSRGRCVTG